MRTARIVNVVLWLYIWFSAVLYPVTAPTADFWKAKSWQLISFNPSLRHPAEFVGFGLIPIVLWFAIDYGLHRASRRQRAPATKD